MVQQVWEIWSDASGLWSLMITCSLVTSMILLSSISQKLFWLDDTIGQWTFELKGAFIICSAAGTMNNNGLELLMNMFGGLGSGAGVPSNPDGYMHSSLSFSTWIPFYSGNLQSHKFWGLSILWIFPLAVPPEERYATQLSQLQEMGFLNTQENIRALSATSGNVHAAVDWLLRNLDR